MYNPMVTEKTTYIGLENKSEVFYSRDGEKNDQCERKISESNPFDVVILLKESVEDALCVHFWEGISAISVDESIYVSLALVPHLGKLVPEVLVEPVNYLSGLLQVSDVCFLAI